MLEDQSVRRNRFAPLASTLAISPQRGFTNAEAPKAKKNFCDQNEVLILKNISQFKIGDRMTVTKLPIDLSL